MTEIHDLIARRFSSRFLRGYVAAKLRSDPIYPAVYERLKDARGPILDLGCGVGLLACYLRERGVTVPILGVDVDAKKVEAGVAATAGYDDVRLTVGDARKRIDHRGSVAMLDLLHYFSDEDQQVLLTNAADYGRPGDVVIIRECLREPTWRYRLTWMEERFATGIGWLKGEKLNFPTRQRVGRELVRRGFEEDVMPLWGKTPFNNYLLTYRCF